MTNQPDKSILTDVADYYTGTITRHGCTPQGVDWNGEQGQRTRFEQLTKILPDSGPFSINDIGCGYGALADFISEQYPQYHYTGIDISPAMIDAASKRFQGSPHHGFVLSEVPPTHADYGVASGIFNLRRNRNDQDWLEYIHQMLDILDKTSTKGFAFNCLTTYSDPEKMQPDLLYYADPCALFDYCKRKYSRHVSLLHDYGLYEFSILVRKAL